VFNVNQEIAQTNIHSRIHQDVIFQNNLNERDIIFAMCHTISRIHKNKEIIMSQILMKINKGQSIKAGIFHLS